MNTKPVISIITVVFNSRALIEKTIQSVVEQTYPLIEYLIIDGGSTDGTMALIEQYRSKITRIVSEKDKGIYDAMNKGLRYANGDYVLFLNAGDLLVKKEIIEEIFSLNASGDVYYSNTFIMNKEGKIIGERRLKPPQHLTWKSLRFGMCVSHQSFIPKRTLCGFYNLTYHFSSDIDWVIRVLKKADNCIFINQPISAFLEGGASAKNRRKALVERMKIMIHYYGLIPTFFNHLYIAVRFLYHSITRRSLT